MNFYYRQLALSLRRQGHDSTFVADAVSEVRAHAAATATTPRLAFGPAATYAKSLGDGSRISAGQATCYLLVTLAIAQFVVRIVHAKAIGTTAADDPMQAPLYTAAILCAIAVVSGRLIDWRLPRQH